MKILMCYPHYYKLVNYIREGIIKYNMENKKGMSYNNNNSIERLCKNCGCLFKIYNFRLKNNSKRGQFCSLNCKKTYSFNGKRYCKICNKILPHTNYKNTCSRECLKKYYINEKRTNWKGGISWKYQNKLKEELILIRGKKCEICGREKGLCIHHIDKNRVNNSINNLKIICYSCHSKIHRWIDNINLRGDVYGS